MRTNTSRVLRAVAAAAALMAAALPMGAGPAAASQGGDDHKVTLCHRTNSENNPYVVITIDKAGVFKTGHDGHDEGGVHHAGDKAAGIRWGDVIPSFDYYASPQDEKAGTVSHYDGLNWTGEGQAYFANGCQAPGTPPDNPPSPGGSLTGSCPDQGDFVVSGSTNADGAEATFRLNIGGTSSVPVAGDFEQTVSAAAGTVVTLEYRVGGGDWTSTDETVTVKDCAVSEQPPTNPRGSYTTECTATGALVDVGVLDRDGATGGRFELVVNGSAQRVTGGQQDIAVPAAASLLLRYVPPQGAVVVLQQGAAPAACPIPTPPSPPSPSENPQRGLAVTKTVTPTGPASVGDTLTYALTVTTTGNATQSNVTVSDYLPGFSPGTTSGTTTYVAGSASCSGAGACTTAYDASSHQVTWSLGTMPAGTSRSVSFQVVIDAPADDTAPADIVNAGSVRSDQVGETPSNQVVTPLSAVEGVKNGPQGGSSSGQPSGETTVSPTRNSLPHTGPGAGLTPITGLALALLLLGSALVVVQGSRRHD